MIFLLVRFDWRRSPKNRVKKREPSRSLSQSLLCRVLAPHVNPMGAHFMYNSTKGKKS